MILESLATLSILLLQLQTTLAKTAPTGEVIFETPSITQTAQNLPTAQFYAENRADSSPISKLAECESGNRWDIRILDTNGKYSYSGLQFQSRTFWSYGKKYGVFAEDTTEAQALKFIYSPASQIQIAEKMLADGLWFHWRNCFAKKNLPK